MIAFDTDVLTEILGGNVLFVERAVKIPASEQAIPIVVVEEIVRGRLNAIRQAKAGRGRLALARAYELFEQSLTDFRHVPILSYTPAAESLFQTRRRQGIRVSTHDLRIAAICIDRSATLVSRNRRDFDRVPGLSVTYWG